MTAADKPRFFLVTLAIGLFAGVAMSLSPPPREWPFFAMLGPPLLLCAMESAGFRPGRSIAAALVCGFVLDMVNLYWIVGLLEVFGRFPLIAAIPVACLLWLAQGSRLAVAAFLAAPILRRGGLPGWLLFPVALSVAFSITPALFPWRPSISVLPWTEWSQLAEVGGEPLLDLLYALAGCGLYEGLRRNRKRTVPLVVGALALLGPAAYGSVRLPQVEAEREAAPSLRVAVIQPNVGILEKHDPEMFDEQLELLRAMTMEAEAAGADIVMWPETAYPYPWPRSVRRDLRPPFAVLGNGVRGPVLFGALTVGRGCDAWNSTLALDAEGHVTGVSDKVELLAFGEYVPLWHLLPPLQEMFACPGITPGHVPRVLELGERRFGVLNCYEDVLAHYGHRVMQERPDLLVNVTNDAWFGDTTEPFLHHYVARVRAIENRRDLVRVVNTGVSGHVLATGESAIMTPTWERTWFIAEVRLLDGTTPWARFGDTVSPMLIGLLLGIASALWKTSPRSAGGRGAAAARTNG